MAKKIIVVLLALLMILPIVTACKKDNNDPKPETKGTETVNGTATEEDNEDAEINAYVAELAASTDTAGKSFTYVGRTSDNFPKKDQETGDIQSDAVYYRQRDISEIFGISWEPYVTDGGEETTDKVINEVSAGGDSYDLVYGNIITVSQPLLNAGVIVRVDTLNTIDLDREWWVSSLRDTYSIKGKLFFLRGPITVESFLDTSCMLFNKTVAAMFPEITDEELYNLAKEGKWTFDEMVRIAAYVPENPTGTGIYRYANVDSVGLIFSTGQTITKFDEDGAPTIEKSLPIELLDLSNKTVGIFSDTSQTPSWDWKKGEDKVTKYKVDKDYDWFRDNKALFEFAGTGDAIYLRQYDVVFGILPSPKGSDTQSRYYSYANPWGSGSVTIPKTTKSIDVTATITEAMAALSQKYLKSAYYDMLLRGQSIFDMESRDMLDIIFKTTVYDMVDIYSGGDVNQWGPLMQTISYCTAYDNSSFASDYSANARVTQFNIKQLLKVVDAQD
ncbi:MAG: hypothetical protein IJS78_06525 [Clostridia bacterium]|nr:hypothetical protein [Clostridia bacterium]